MLSSVILNSQVTKIVMHQCLKCHESLELSTIVKIFKNCQNCQKIQSYLPVHMGILPVHMGTLQGHMGTLLNHMVHIYGDPTGRPLRYIGKYRYNGIELKYRYWDF